MRDRLRGPLERRPYHEPLFVERCREDLVLDSLGRLGDPTLEDLVLEAVDRYKLRAAFLV